MLDGLESESAGRVCIMMTAMEVGHLPLALVRSGRVELWLEMKLPDEHARGAILERQLQKSSNVFPTFNLAAVLLATDGFTGADLKRVVADAKSLYAFDCASGVERAAAEDYLLKAVQSVALNKQRYAKAEAGAQRQESMASRIASTVGFMIHPPSM